MHPCQGGKIVDYKYKCLLNIKIEIHIHTLPVDNLDKYPVQINNKGIK